MAHLWIPCRAIFQIYGIPHFPQQSPHVSTRKEKNTNLASKSFAENFEFLPVSIVRRFNSLSFQNFFSKFSIHSWYSTEVNSLFRLLRTVDCWNYDRVTCSHPQRSIKVCLAQFTFLRNGRSLSWLKIVSAILSLLLSRNNLLKFRAKIFGNAFPQRSRRLMMPLPHPSSQFHWFLAHASVRVDTGRNLSTALWQSIGTRGILEKPQAKLFLQFCVFQSYFLAIPSV